MNAADYLEQCSDEIEQLCDVVDWSFEREPGTRRKVLSLYTVERLTFYLGQCFELHSTGRARCRVCAHDHFRMVVEGAPFATNAAWLPLRDALDHVVDHTDEARRNPHVQARLVSLLTARASVPTGHA